MEKRTAKEIGFSMGRGDRNTVVIRGLINKKKKTKRNIDTFNKQNFHRLFI